MSIKIYVKYVKNNRDFYTTKMNLPTGSLDECNRDYVLEILQELNYQGKTIVVVTHDPHVNECAQRHIMLKAIQKSKEAEAYTRAMNTIRFSSEQKAHIIKCVADEKEQSNKS